MVVRGYYLFREANSCPRAKLEGNCELRGTDNVQGQLFVHISEAKSSLLSLLSFKYFLSQRIRSGTKQNKTRSKTRRLVSGRYWVTFRMGFTHSMFPSNTPWKYTVSIKKGTTLSGTTQLCIGTVQLDWACVQFMHITGGTTSSAKEPKMLNPSTPKSDQFQISPAASPEI